MKKTAIMRNIIIGVLMVIVGVIASGLIFWMYAQRVPYGLQSVITSELMEGLIGAVIFWAEVLGALIGIFFIMVGMLIIYKNKKRLQ